MKNNITICFHERNELMKKIPRASVIKWLPLIVLSLALMIIVVDTTVLNVSIRNILEDLNTNVQGIQWVISAYSLTLAAFTVTGGRLGDLFGRKRMFVIGAILFAIGSLVTSLAPTIAWVIIGNALIEGLGAALMMPATASLLVSTYRGKDRAIGFAVWGGVAAAGAALGPIVGGYLTTNFSWRWAFRINLVVVVLLLIGTRFIKESREKSEKIELDVMGILLSSVGLTSLVYGFIESSSYGWFHATKDFALFGHSFAPLGLSVTPIAIVLGIILLVVFGWWEQRHELRGHTPLVSLALFKNKQFTFGASVTALLALGQTGLVFAIPIFYQSVRGLDAFHTGLGLLPMSLGIMIGAPSSLKFIKRFTPKHVSQFGFVLMTLGMLDLAAVLSPESTVWSLAFGLGLYGLGTGFAMSQLSNLTLSAVSVQQSGEASGVNSTIRQIGASFGSAIIGAALIATLTSSMVKKIEANTVIPNPAKPQIIAGVREAGSNIEFVTPKEHQVVPPRIAHEITKNTHQATVEGNKVALLFAGGFAVLALLLSTQLPNIHDLETGEKAHVASAH